MVEKPSFKITRSTKISVLSGAGISAESGIPTFRSADGLWNDANLAKLATPRGFLADPERGWEFYDKRRQNMAACKPNHAHMSLAQMEKDGYDITVITQNIDRLHQRAGSTGVIELHGTVWELKCSNPSCAMSPFENHDVPLKERYPICDYCHSPLRPNVVFFEEILDEKVVRAANARTLETELLLVIGTSGIVYPAAGFAQLAKMNGAYVVELNIEETPLTYFCDETRLGKCGETLPALLEEFSSGEYKFISG